MPAKLLEGAPIVEKIMGDVAVGVADLKSRGIMPKLVALQVGESSSGTRGYIKSQQSSSESCGVEHEVREMPADTTEEQLMAELARINADRSIHGVILMVPLPPHLNARKIQVMIAPSKDVEGMHPENMGRLFYGDQRVAPCTAMAAIEVLLSAGLSLAGREVVILGRSQIVGRPAAMLLLQSQKNAPTVTVCHTGTDKAGMTPFHTKRADVIISAVGVKPNLVTGEMIKQGATVIDVATMQIPDLAPDGTPVLDKKGKPKKRWVGDVDAVAAMEKCEFLAPVPGGVGPVTAAILMRNLLACAGA